MIGKLKEMFGIDRRLSEAQMAIVLKKTRKGDEEKRREAMKKLEELGQKEKRLFELARVVDTTEMQKLNYAREVKAIRAEAKTYETKVDLYQNRLRVVNEYLSSVETVSELKAEAAPSMAEVEAVAIRAKTLLGELDELKDVAHAIGTPPEMLRREDSDPDLEGIVGEMKERALEDARKKKEAEEKAKKDKEKKVKTPWYNRSKKDEDLYDMEEA